ncbi:MAG: GtrA family protein [Rhodobiaceae bacterium]|nr:GtrA family protein [Rhodobiaceae bacterium]MCC0054364.1 GtrA family protein [Rhodobiaceae bacterium]
MRPDQFHYSKKEAGAFGRYIVSGVIGNVLVLFAYYSFTFLLDWRPGFSFTIACAIILPITFLLSRNFTFRSEKNIARAFKMFLLGYMASFLFQFGVLTVGLFLGFQHTLIIPIGQLLTVIFFFTLQRFFIFGLGSRGTE